MCRFDADQVIVTTRYASLCWICHHSNSIRITNWLMMFLPFFSCDLLDTLMTHNLGITWVLSILQLFKD
jgi:hypothetical protein